jgi:hypothetical protein
MTPDPSLPDEYRPQVVTVDRVRKGDTIEWCGRRAAVCHIEPDRHHRRSEARAGILLTLEGDGFLRRCHYFLNQRVVIVDRRVAA